MLDHGYVELVETWGSDARIIEAARMSTDKGALGWDAQSEWICNTCGYTTVVPHNDPSRQVVHDYAPMITSILGDLIHPVAAPHLMTYVKGHNGDAKLLAYLWKHKHYTPFEMAGLTLEVQAPIFVFREWHRHRTQSYNELSARYTELPNLFYLPSDERINHGRQSTTNKQGSAAGVLPREWHEMLEIQENIRSAFIAARDAYERLLALGVAREIARIVIPVAQYSRMRASANLRNWLGFLALRLDPAAQWEIRQYAALVGQLIAAEFPRTWALFSEEQIA